MTDVTISPGTYVVAVSGGVDSVVLLDMLTYQPNVHLIVAHVDHGIRDDSASDAVLVQQLAARYDLPFEQCRLHLGKTASEEKARRERYRFLQAVAQKHQAIAIITAHHADDVVETIIINILRGTGWRGLCSLRSHNSYLRPLLSMRKAELLAYAHAHHLKWHEDSTNQLPHYLRNYVRLTLLPRLLEQQPTMHQQLLERGRQQCQLRDQIEPLVDEVLTSLQDKTGLKRHLFCQLDAAVADELLRRFLQNHAVSQTAPQRQRAIHFIQTAATNKLFSLNAAYYLQLQQKHIIVTPVKN